uniref:CD3 gamma/delta subunit Ig-like domain-containing protein n=1 Tax=Leptobrachium leishanense TaxID=445787 RepID=A0A8C5W8F3_9ANUR
FSLCSSQGHLHKQTLRVKEKYGRIHLECPVSYDTWKKDNTAYGSKNNTLDLGSIWNDPQGYFTCENSSKDLLHIYVFVRMCQNCIEMDAGTISGFLVADIIMIGLIALAVYYVSGSEIRRPARASDKQNLITNDSEYEALSGRQEDQYSQLQNRKI